jgi:hypothetical protein
MIVTKDSAMPKFSVLLLTAPAGPGLDPGGAIVKVDGRESLLRSVELFLNRDNISQIQLAVLPAAMEEFKRKFGGHLGFSGVKLVPGGPHLARPNRRRRRKTQHRMLSHPHPRRRPPSGCL